jgi:hypothetical protein
MNILANSLLGKTPDKLSYQEHEHLVSCVGLPFDLINRPLLPVGDRVLPVAAPRARVQGPCGVSTGAGEVGILTSPAVDDSFRGYRTQFW